MYAISGAVGEVCQVATMYPLSTIAVRLSTIFSLLFPCQVASHFMWIQHPDTNNSHDWRRLRPQST